MAEPHADAVLHIARPADRWRVVYDDREGELLAVLRRYVSRQRRHVTQGPGLAAQPAHGRRVGHPSAEPFAHDRQRVVERAALARAPHVGEQLHQGPRRGLVEQRESGAVGHLDGALRNPHVLREELGHRPRARGERARVSRHAADGAERQLGREVVAAVVDHRDQLVERHRAAHGERATERVVACCRAAQHQLRARRRVVHHRARAAGDGDAARLELLAQQAGREDGGLLDHEPRAPGPARDRDVARQLDDAARAPALHVDTGARSRPAGGHDACDGVVVVRRLDAPGRARAHPRPRFDGEPDAVLGGTERRGRRRVRLVGVVRRPSRPAQLGTEERRVPDDVAAHAADPGPNHAVGEWGEARGVEREGGVPRAVEHEVAEQLPAPDGPVGEQHRHEPEVGAEVVQRGGGREQLRVRGRDEAPVGVVREQRVAASEAHDERAPRGAAPDAAPEERRELGGERSLRALLGAEHPGAGGGQQDRERKAGRAHREQYSGDSAHLPRPGYLSCWDDAVSALRRSRVGGIFGGLYSTRT